MRRGLLALAVVAVVVLAAWCAAAVAAPPPIVAPAYIVRGGPMAVVLAARSPDVARAPASMTKLMTVLVALEHARLSDGVTVSPQAARVGESSVNLRAGERLTVHDLAIAALVPSANDAATALAVYVGNGSIPRFVAMMNAKAKELSLSSTHFENPHGLDQPASFVWPVLAPIRGSVPIRSSVEVSVRPPAIVAVERVDHVRMNGLRSAAVSSVVRSRALER